jgi:hypothetical protein
MVWSGPSFPLMGIIYILGGRFESTLKILENFCIFLIVMRPSTFLQTGILPKSISFSKTRHLLSLTNPTHLST